MEKVFMPFGKMFVCPKCGAGSSGIEWQGSTFDEPKEGLAGVYEDEYKCDLCGCNFIIAFNAYYTGTYIDAE